MQSMYEFQTLSWNWGILLNVLSKEQIAVGCVSGGANVVRITKANILLSFSLVWKFAVKP